MVKPQVREPVTDVPLTGADQECDARLHQAERRLQKLLDSQKESRGEDDVKQGSSFAAMLSARREVKEAIQASRTAYMRSAFRNDVLALQATLNKFNTTLAAEWEVALVEQTQRGIFMLAGPRDGSVYLINAFATLWVIRHHFKSKLPVVIMYWGASESVNTRIQDFFKAELGQPAVSFVDASSLPWPAHHRALFLAGETYKEPGWAIKMAAAYLVPFQEVLYLDTDSVPLVQPETLFDLPDYKRTGSLFWPDKPMTRPPIFDDLIEMGLIDEGDAPKDMRQTEAGQWLLDRHRHREALEYILFMGTRSDYAFTKGYGDKDMYLAGFALAGAAADYSLVQTDLGMGWGPLEKAESGSNAKNVRNLRGYVQYSPADNRRPLFFHRTGDSIAVQTKYRLDASEGRPLDVISGPLPREWSYPMFVLRFTTPWSETDLRVVDPSACPFSLDEGFGNLAARCNNGFKGKEGEQAPVYAVAGTQVGAALAAQEEGFHRVLQEQRRIPSIFPEPSLVDKLARLRSRP